ncbi:MAG TPA: hypothetical protein VJ873_09885 [bacterium]|nr:hypothetical protein [bacterium]
MASRKKAVSGGKGGQNLLSLLFHPNTLSAAAVILALIGVWLLQGKHSAWGFLPLGGVVLLLAAILQGWAPEPGKLPSFGRGGKAPRAQKKKSSLNLWKSLVQWKLPLLGVVCVLAGLALGAVIQAVIVSSPEVPGWKLWGLYTLAGVFFVIGLFLLQDKKAAEPAPLSEKTEKFAFFAILILAAFMRIYRLGSMPSGLFIDQGMEGWSALKILHERSYWPVWEFDVWQNPALLLYQLAGWFLLLTPFHMEPSQFWFYLFYALFSLATFPLVYWTFRQIGGQRLALLGMFILAVMRWNINFSRNGFPTIEVPFYMFGTLAFLTYAMRPTKSRYFRPAAIAAGVFFLLGCLPFLALAFGSVLSGMHLWALALAVILIPAGLACVGYLWTTLKDRESYLSAVIAGGIFAMGLYTYQAYKIVPLLILLFALYELASRPKEILAKWKSIAGFSIAFLVLAFPYFKHTLNMWGQGSREGELLIFSRVHEQHSWQPLIYNLWRTAVMFHWHGDAMSRHNIQDYRMLDDVTGVLFFLGIVGAVVFLRKKPWFYGLTGLLVMTVPCVLSIDAAHANRMLGTTPFIALLAALPLSALWSRYGSFFREKGKAVFFPLLLVLPLGFMTLQNYNAYFNIMARSLTSWSEYAARETAIGKAIAKYGDDYDYYITPVYYNYYTITFFGYFHQDRIHPLLLPDSEITHTPNTSRGMYFAIEQSRPGLLDMAKSLYPGGTAEYLLDPAGNTAEYFYRVSASEVAKVRSLKAHFDPAVEGSTEKQIAPFPEGLPKGPYRAVLSGNLYVAQTGEYRWDLEGNVMAELRLKNQRPLPGGFYRAEKGEHPVEVVLTVPQGVTPVLAVHQIPRQGVPTILDAGSFDSLPPGRGLLGRYYHDTEGKGQPFLEEWDPVLNFTNGNDFSTPPNCSIRWSGTLNVTEAGPYRLFTNPPRSAQLQVDGKGLNGGDKDLFLNKGPHSLELFLASPSTWNSFTLAWVKPDGTTEVVPMTAFGEVR